MNAVEEAEWQGQSSGGGSSWQGGDWSQHWDQSWTWSWDDKASTRAQQEGENNGGLNNLGHPDRLYGPAESLAELCVLLGGEGEEQPGCGDDWCEPQ